MKWKKDVLAFAVIQAVSVSAGFAAESHNTEELTALLTVPLQQADDFDRLGRASGQETERTVHMTSNLPPENAFNRKNSLRSIFGPDNLIKLSDGAKVTVDSNNSIEFHSGEMLVWAIGETRVKCFLGSITLAPQTVVLIHGSNSAVSLASLYECKAQSTIVRSGAGNEIYVSAGNSLSCGNGRDELASFLSIQQVGRRGVRTWRGADNKDYLRSEISLVSLLHESRLLYELSKRPTKAEQLIVDRVMKMAACLHVATSHRGPYASVKL